MSRDFKLPVAPDGRDPVSQGRFNNEVAALLRKLLVKLAELESRIEALE